jgi:glycosyltransferase involved in cell wall biosynthesis
MNNFSVLISIYYKESAENLNKCLESLVFQTLPATEIVIVKDGTLTLELEDVLASWNCKLPLKIYGYEQNKGLAYALNYGFQFCTYELVARMDTDDICYKDRFEKQILFLNNHDDVDIVGTYVTKIDNRGEFISLLKLPSNNKDIKRLIWACPLIHPTVMYRKEKILNIGGYNPNAGIRQDDYELWFRCASKGLGFANIPEPLLFYRFFPESIRKYTPKIGWYRLKVGVKGCLKLNYSLFAYIGVFIPFIRSLLPFPLSMYFDSFIKKFDPRSKI